MPEPPQPPEPRDPVSAPGTASPRGPAVPVGRGGLATSLAVVVAGRSPREALALVAEASGNVTAGVRLEYLVLDDHGDPGRRALFEAMQSIGEVTHFVRRPGGGRAAELDALTVAATSEFVVVCGARIDLLEALDAALGIMWVDGADAAVVGVEAGSSPGTDTGPPGLDAAGRLAGYLGIGMTAPGGQMVVIRRWVVRWLLSEIERAVDPAEEFADRGRLLGFGMVELSATGQPLR